MSARTDLAMEARELIREEIEGVEEEKYNINFMHITHVSIKNEAAAKQIGKPMGEYVTIETENMCRKNTYTISAVAEVLAEELRKIHTVNDTDSILIVGLGNHAITPDAIGPKTVQEVLVTRHLWEYMPNHMDHRVCRVSAVAPGVLGTTGIETGEIVFGLVEKVKPTLVVAVDALVSLHAERVATTIQMTDTGIHPGSGVGNNRRGLNDETMGVPVIAIGIPTILDTAGFFKENMMELMDAMSCEELSNQQKDNLLSKLSSWTEPSFFVTPKDMDALSDMAAKILALGIDLWLHSDMSEEELMLYR